jgi:hypothetical protein
VSARKIQAALHALLQEEASANQRNQAERHANLLQAAIDAGRRLRLHVVITCASIFFSFLLRACYTTIFTVASALQDSR